MEKNSSVQRDALSYQPGDAFHKDLGLQTVVLICTSEEEAEEMNSSVRGKSSKGISNVTVSSEALLFKRTASEGSSQGICGHSHPYRSFIGLPKPL